MIVPQSFNFCTLLRRISTGFRPPDGTIITGNIHSWYYGVDAALRLALIDANRFGTDEHERTIPVRHGQNTSRRGRTFVSHPKFIVTVTPRPFM
jgi:hypothetical protein